MKKMSLLLCLLSFSAWADLFKLEAGTFNGKIQYNKERANLFLVEYPGRAGSFLGVILSRKKRAYAYLVDKFAPNTYGMIPMQVMDNGVIGVTNSHPSLNLKMVLRGKRKFIQIVDAGDLNNTGFGSSMRFEYDDHSRRQRLSNSLPGSYRYKSRKHIIAVGSQDHNNETYFTANTEIFNGDYVLREVRPGMHLPLRSTLKNTGIEVSDDANGLVIFVKKECVFGTGNHMLYIENSGHVKVFKKI